MTADDVKYCGIPVKDTSASAVLAVESALEYVKANTSLKFDLTDIESIKALPSCAKLFASKYCELMTAGRIGVSSESLGGMSQSFDTADKNKLLYTLLQSLLGEYVTSQFRGIPRIRRYRCGR